VSKEEISAEELHLVLDAAVRKIKSGADWMKLLDVAALHPTYGFGNLVLIDLQIATTRR
jgi:hypothetical protein